MVTTLGPYTVVDLERMREESKDRLELIDGEVFVVPAPNIGHQDVQANLVFEFVGQIARRGRGRVFPAPTDLRFSDVRDVQPDLIVVLPGDGATINPERIEGVPSLVVEIVSPSSRVQDRRVKRALYADAGVPEYWIVDHAARSVVVLSDPANGDYRTETTYGDGDTVRSATILDITVPVADIFPPITGHGA